MADLSVVRLVVPLVVSKAAKKVVLLVALKVHWSVVEKVGLKVVEMAAL